MERGGEAICWGIGRGDLTSKELKHFSENARQKYDKKSIKLKGVLPFWRKRIQPPFWNSLHVCKGARGGRGVRDGVVYLSICGVR